MRTLKIIASFQGLWQIFSICMYLINLNGVNSKWQVWFLTKDSDNIAIAVFTVVSSVIIIAAIFVWKTPLLSFILLSLAFSVGLIYALKYYISIGRETNVTEFLILFSPIAIYSWGAWEIRKKS